MRARKRLTVAGLAPSFSLVKAMCSIISRVIASSLTPFYFTGRPSAFLYSRTLAGNGNPKKIMSNARQEEKKDELKEIEDRLDASLRETAIELEKNQRNNPNNKVKRRFIPGDSVEFKGINNIDASSWAVLFPNKSPKEIAELFAGPATSTTPQMKN